MSCSSLCLILTPQTPDLVFDSRISVGTLAFLVELSRILIPLISVDLRLQILKDRTSDKRGVSEWDQIKILLKGDDFSNKLNTPYPTFLQLELPKFAKSRIHLSATDPKSKLLNQLKQPLHTRSGNLHNMLSVPHRSDQGLFPVRPVITAGQAVGNNRCTTTF
jgi:hypothetical protein